MTSRCKVNGEDGAVNLKTKNKTTTIRKPMIDFF